MTAAAHVSVGVHDDLPIEVYHGDCCEGPSISSTSIRQCARDPFGYWRTSPLNPAYKAAEEAERLALMEAGTPPPAKKFVRFAKGSAAHLMLLEPELIGQGVAVVPQEILASNGALSTKAAKQFVADRAAEGRVVLTPTQWNDTVAMADALSADARVRRLLDNGTVEQSHIWQDADTGVYLKSRPDFTPDDPSAWIVDYKTTDIEDVERWERAATCDHRLDMQAALQMAGANMTRGHEPEGVVYIVQHTKTARIAIRWFHKNDHADLLAVARADLRRGINTFAECWATETWDGPWEIDRGIEAPDFRQRQIEKQLEATPTAFAGEYGL